MQKFKELVTKFLDSPINIALYVIIASLGWCFGIAHISLLILAVYSSICIFFFDKFESTLIIFLGAPYVVGDWTNSENMLFNIIAISIALVSIISFVIKKLIQKHKFKKGELFYFFIPCLFAYLLAGVIGHFDIINFVFTFAVCLVIYGYYFLFLNFAKNKSINLPRAIIGICFIIIIEIIYQYLTVEDFWLAIYAKSIRIGAGEINTSAIYLGLGIVSSLYLTAKENKTYFLYITMLCLVGTFFTYSRIALAVNTLIFIIAIIISFYHAQNKINFLITSSIILCILFVIILAFRCEMYELVKTYLDRGFDGNGREELWGFCKDKFEQNKLFGIGFTNNTPVPSLEAQILPGKYLIYCHNIFIQLFTCTGIIGFALNLPLLIKKWKIVISKTDNTFIHIMFGLALITIASCGMFDASGGLGIFMCFMTLSLVCSLEDDIRNGKESTIKANYAKE